MATKILDGSTGIALLARGMPKDAIPSVWALDNAKVLQELQREYMEAGSDIVCSCTISLNPLYMQKHKIDYGVIDINKRLVEISKQTGALVAGDMSTSGEFIEPVGDVTFDEMIAMYEQQARGLFEGGADYILIETMIDLRETIAAVSAIKRVCDLPILVTMTFAENGRTLSGDTAEGVAVALTNMGVHAVGVNCGFGPDLVLPILKRMRQYTHLPLIAKPNAGLPKYVDGDAVFDTTPEQFVETAHEYAALGIAYAGGCCGTLPAHIKELSNKIKSCEPATFEPTQYITNGRKVCELSAEASPIIPIYEAEDADLDDYDYAVIAVESSSDIPALLEFAYSCPLPIKTLAPAELLPKIKEYGLYGEII